MIRGDIILQFDQMQITTIPTSLKI